MADAAQARSCYWKFVLLKLSILRAEIFSDGIEEVAEIEALLEEAAELVNEFEQKNPSYYRSVAEKFFISYLGTTGIIRIFWFILFLLFSFVLNLFVIKFFQGICTI